MGLLFEFLFSGLVVGFCVYQLYSVRRDIRKAAEEKAKRSNTD